MSNIALWLAGAVNLPNQHQAIEGRLLRDAPQQPRFRTASVDVCRSPER
jgi:hypothetical protein